MAQNAVLSMLPSNWAVSIVRLWVLVLHVDMWNTEYKQYNATISLILDYLSKE